VSSKRSAPGVADLGLVGTDEVEADVDAGPYRLMQGHRYPTILLSIVAAAARAATLRLVPLRRSL
jgi:hypothetical protein